MMRFLTFAQILEIHKRVIAQAGGSIGVRDMAGLESAVAQPKMTFDGQELYPSLIEKAAALGFSIVLNHPFVDGNKRTGHASMEIFLVLNGFEIEASTDEQEEIILGVAAGKIKREQFAVWLESVTVTRG
ncbi:MAG: type II toxin-antitoxin system death-on-curing family toxin [Chloroflexota bacterium]